MASDSRALIHDLDYSQDPVEECYRRGWTDGMPVAPPTVEKVNQMLDYVGLSPGDVLGEVPVRRRVLTAEQAAANCVMAGCLPEYFPIVLAAMKALFDHDPNCIHEISAVTNSTGIMLLVNGPIRKNIDLNCTDNLFSPGYRANSTIGRAIRLIFINVFEQRPGVLDRGCMGSLTKYSVCFGEDEEDSPWEPYHVTQGFAADQSTVTVSAIQDPEMFGNRYGTTGESLMDSIVEGRASHGLAIYFGRGIKWFWVVGHWHAEMLNRLGWTRPLMQEYIQEKSYRTRAQLKGLGYIKGEIVTQDETEKVYAAQAAEDILIVKAGGNSGIYSNLIMNYNGVEATTVPILDPKN